MDERDLPLTLILGGARSGKSRYAEALAPRLGEHVLYVATAEALDDEMRARVAAHRAARPVTWQTLEAPRRVGQALLRSAASWAVAAPQAAAAGVILLDCLTLLVSNVLLSGGPAAPEPDVDTAMAWLRAELDDILAARARLGAYLVVVSNEVGLGVVPPYALGRTYRDCLGWANQSLARVARQVILMVAGLPVDLKALPLAWPDQDAPGG